MPVNTYFPGESRLSIPIKVESRLFDRVIGGMQDIKG